MKKIIFVFGLIVLIAASRFAQAEGESKQDRWEKIRAEKVAFLTEKLELTPTEAQKFWPVYNQLDKERWEAQKMRRDLEQKVHDAEATLSAKEVIKLTRDFANGMQKEASLLVKYNEDFLKILPPQKVLRLYQAENDFRMHMIRKFREKPNEEGKK